MKMSVLVIVEHNNNDLLPATLHTVNAAKQIGNTDALVIGNNCQTVIKSTSKIEGINEVLFCDEKIYEILELKGKMMQKTAQKVYEILTKLEKESIIDNETALAIFESMLKSVEPDEINNIFGNVPTFKSALDKDVANRTKSIEDKYKTEITSKDSKISELSQLIPKESDPEKIKKQLDLSTDPNERRLLQLEYNNAIATNQLAKLESEKRAKTF